MQGALLWESSSVPHWLDIACTDCAAPPSQGPGVSADFRG